MTTLGSWSRFLFGVVVWCSLVRPLAAVPVERWVNLDAPAINADATANDGRDEDHAVKFTVPVVNAWLQDTQLTDLTVHFIAPEPPNGGDVESADLPSYHFVVGGPTGNERLVITNGAVAKRIRLLGKENTVGQRPVLRFEKSKYVPSGGWGSSSTIHDWMIRTYPVVGSDGATHLDHFELRDLVLDGDFENQGPFASVSHPGGYKGSACWVYSRTGLLDNLLVRRFGVVGRMPQSYFDPPAGTETFVVQFHTKAGDKNAGDWSPADGSRSFPWEVRRVNIEEFTSLHGGYTTLLMPIAFYDVAPEAMTFDEPPVVAIRQCQIIGNQDTIALGTAGLPGAVRRIDFQDNVILNSATAVNTDTGDIGFMKIRRNAFIDGLFGIRQGPSQHDYRIEDNLFRLRGRAYLPNYRNYNYVAAPGTTVTDPNLVLGRKYLPPCNVLMWDGGIQRMEFRNNWITTWPSDQGLFQLPVLEPVSAADLKYHPIWTMPSGFINEVWGSATRYPSLQITLKDNHISPAAMEFRPGSVTTGPLNSVNLALSSPPPSGQIYSSDYQNLRDPAPLDPVIASQFVPRGMVNRLHPNFFVDDDLDPNNDPYDEGQLVSVTEVTLGDCQLAVNGSQVTVTAKARILDHVLPRTVGAQTVAAASVPSQLRVTPAVVPGVLFRTEVLVNGVSLPAQSSPEKFGERDAVTGIASTDITFHAALGVSTSHCVVRIVAFSVTGADLNKFEPNHDAWASMEKKFGNVVEVTANPDVGDDKNTTSSDKRAKFVIRRTAANAADLQNPLSVRLRLRNHLRDDGSVDPKLVNLAGQSLIATYGNSGTADYYLAPQWPTTSLAIPSPVQTVTIPGLSPTSTATEATLTLQVVARPDNLTENNVIVLEVVPDSNTSAPTYSVGTKSRARVLLYDGPEFTLQELSLSNFGGPTSASAAYALNNKSGTTEPRIAGTGTYMSQNQYGQYVPVSYGGWWQWPNPGTFTSLYNLPYYGISTSPVKLVGWQGASAYVTTTTTAGFTYLPDLFTAAWQATAAWGINPSATYIVGSSKNSAARYRPVAWWASSPSIFDLGSGLNQLWEGHARAANDLNQFAGQFHVEYTGGDAGKFAFRTKPNAPLIEFNAANGSGDMLHAILTDELNNREGEASWIRGDGTVVGWSKNEFNKREATLWSSSLPASSVAAVRLFGWQSRTGGIAEEYSAAKGISQSGWIVGWSGATDAPGRAVLRRTVSSNPKDWQDLNDRHFSHGANGWVLKSADAINDLNYIVGNGTLYGQPRAFLLVPRTPEN